MRLQTELQLQFPDDVCSLQGGRGSDEVNGKCGLHVKRLNDNVSS